MDSILNFFERRTLGSKLRWGTGLLPGMTLLIGGESIYTARRQAGQVGHMDDKLVQYVQYTTLRANIIEAEPLLQAHAQLLHASVGNAFISLQAQVQNFDFSEALVALPPAAATAHIDSN